MSEKGSLGEAVLDLAADGAGLLKDINKAKPGVLGALDGLGKAGGLLLATGLTVAATALVGLTKMVWDAGQTLDAAYDAIQIKTGATGDVLEGLQEDFKKVFSSVPADAETVADVIGTLNSRLGATGEELQGLARPLLEFSRLTKTDASANAEQFGQIVGNWDIPLDQAVKKLDAIYVAAQKTGVPVDQLMQTILDSGPVLRQYGFGFEDAAAFLAKMNQAGIDSTAMMMGLKSAAAKYAAEGKPLNKGLKDSLKLIKDAKDPTEALNIAIETFGARAGPAMVDAIRSGKMEFSDLIPILQQAEGAILDNSKSTMDWTERWQMFQNKLTTVFGPGGMGLMEAVNDMLTTIEDTLERPDVQKGIMMIVDGIVYLVQQAALHLPTVIALMFQLVEFLRTHQPIVAAILTVLAALFVAFAAITAAALITALAPFAEIIAIIAVVAAAAYLLWLAWETNFLGIKGIVMAIWNWLQPILKKMWDWLAVNIPEALKMMKDYWTFQVMPVWHKVYAWIMNNLFPLFKALADFFGAVFNLHIRTMAAIWQNVLWPALKKVADFLSTILAPAFKALSDWWKSTGEPIARAIADWFGKYITSSFNNLVNILKTVTTWLTNVTNTLNNMKLPKWMTPGSPTPWEIGLVGVNDALKGVANIGLPAMEASMGAMSAPAMAGGMQLAAGGAGGVTVAVNYSPMISTADEYEAQRVLAPMIIAEVRRLANE